MKKVDNSPTKIGYVKSLNCLRPQCNRAYTLQNLIDLGGTIFQNGPYPSDDPKKACICSQPLDVRYDYDTIKKEITIKDIEKRYHDESKRNFYFLNELLPFNVHIVGKDMPFSPLKRAENIEKDIQKRYKKKIKVFLKLDCELPTGSFKDRPTIAAYNKALEEGGYTNVLTSSTGNLSDSVMHYAADTANYTTGWGFSANLLIPHTVGDKKLSNMRNHTNLPDDYIPKEHWKHSKFRKIIVEELAKRLLNNDLRQITRIEGNYDEANRLANEIAHKANNISLKEIGRHITFIPNDTFRPYYKEGSKTQIFETIFQLRFDHDIYGAISPKIITVGGSGALGCQNFKGANELKLIGLSQADPIIYVAQGEGCFPIVDALINNKEYIDAVIPNTIAKSIAIGNPGSGYQIKRHVSESGGAGIMVKEPDIYRNTLELNELEGIVSQYVGGVTLGALYEGINEGHFVDGDIVILNITGSGKKITDDIATDLDKFRFKKTEKSRLEKKVTRFIKKAEAA